MLSLTLENPTFRLFFKDYSLACLMHVWYEIKANDALQLFFISKREPFHNFHHIKPLLRDQCGWIYQNILLHLQEIFFSTSGIWFLHPHGLVGWWGRGLIQIQCVVFCKLMLRSSDNQNPFLLPDLLCAHTCGVVSSLPTCQFAVSLSNIVICRIGIITI